MLASNGLLVPGIIVTLFIALVVWIRAANKKRTQALADLAPTIGFRFEGNAWTDPTQTPRLQMSLFQGKSRARFANIMTGTFAGFRTSVFDYSYRSGKSTHQQTVVAISQDAALPLFDLVPNNVLIRSLLPLMRTVKKIDFDSHPEFSKRFLVFGLPEERIRELFTPALLGFLESLPAKEIWHIEGEGPTLIVYRTMGVVRPQDLQAHLEKTAFVARGFLGSAGLRKTA